MTRRTRSKGAAAAKEEMRASQERQSTFGGPTSESSSARRPATAAVHKENVENERRDFQPPSSSITTTPAPRKRELTPKDVASAATTETNRSAPSLFSPPPSSGRGTSSRQGGSVKKSPSSLAYPENWEGGRQPASRSRGQERRESGREVDQQDSLPYATPYRMQQTDPRANPRSAERRMELREGGRGPGGSYVHRQPEGAPRDMSSAGYGTLSADLDMVAREGSGDDDFGPPVADVLNLGSFAEESPPRQGQQQQQPRSRQQQRGSPRSPRAPPYPSQQGQPYPYRASPPPPQQGYGSYYPQGPPPGSSPSYAYPPPGAFPFRFDQPPQPFPDLPPGDQQPWTSPPAQQFDNYPDSKYPAAEQQGTTTARRSPPPPKKRRAWDNGSSSSPGSEGDAGTPEKAFSKKPADARSPFRSPPVEKGSTKKYKRSPLFQGGTPGIAGIGAYGSWDTPGGTGGTLGASLGDDFSPMAPSFAPFGGDSPLREGVNDAPLPFEAKLSLEEPPSGEDAAAAAQPVIRQRPPGQPSSSPFSSFVAEFSPFPGMLQGSPSGHDPRDYSSRHHAGYYRPPEEYPRTHPGIPPHSASKLSSHGHPKSALMMSPSVVPSHPGAPPQRPPPWMEQTAPSPGPFRLELGESQFGQTRKGFEDINSVLRGTAPPPKQYQRSPPASAPQVRYQGARPRSTPQSMSTPVKLEPAPMGRSVGSATRTPAAYSASKQPPVGSAPAKFTPLTKGKATTPRKTPSKGMVPMSTPMPQQRRNPCNCKKSKCLKLYCECFACELYCDGCNCAECRNTTVYETERQKAMKETRAKNPNAFKPRIAVRGGAGPPGSTPPAGHQMGCRCKRSECLKKYCECFQAGVMCGNKCKCVDCLNYVGSQALIDKRRKIKDHKGAELAMQIADQAWKGGTKPRGMTPRGRMRQPSPPGSRHGPQMSIPAHMIQPSPAPHHQGPHAHFMAPPMMGHPHMGYSPMGIPPATPAAAYLHGQQQLMPSAGGRPDAPRASAPYVDPSQQRTPTLTTPKTPHARSRYDPHSSKKKRKLRPGAKEPTLPYFGKCPEQPKTTALAIFSYLSNDDLYTAGLVCKQWSRLAMDEELWQF